MSWTHLIGQQPVFENLVERDFDIEQPDQVYAADITYVWTQEGWLYLAVVIDLCTRKVVGWSMSSRMKAQLVCDALQMAIWRRQPADLIHHSDRGSQYASKAFRRLLKAHGIKGSMSRKGDCWHNAVVESFFGSLKQERVQSVFVNIVAAFFYAAFFNFSFGLSGLRVMIPGRSQFLVSPHQRDGLAALAWR